MSRIPDNVPFEEAALLEPLSVVLHGVRTGGLSLGRPALICGAGPIGLIALAAARASGAHPIVITDVEPKRLAFAKEFVPGCTTYQIDVKSGAEENAKEIRRLYGADADEYLAPPTVLECTGVESSVCTAAFAVRRGGVVCVIGVGRSVMNNLPFMHISLAEVSSHVLTGPVGILMLTDLDRPPVHQPIPGHLAGGDRLSKRWDPGPEEVDNTQVPVGEGGGCHDSVFGY